MLNKRIPTVVGILIIVLLAGGAVATVFLLKDADEVIISEKKELLEKEEMDKIMSFEECIEKEYQAFPELSPIICKTPDGEFFAKGIDKNKIFQEKNLFVLPTEGGEKFQRDSIVQLVSIYKCNEIFIIGDALKSKIEKRIEYIFKDDAVGFGYKNPWSNKGIISPKICEVNLGINEKEYIAWYPTPAKNVFFDIYGKTKNEWNVVLSGNGVFFIEEGKVKNIHNILMEYSFGAGSGQKVRYQWNFSTDEYDRYQAWDYYIFSY